MRTGVLVKWVHRKRPRIHLALLRGALQGNRPPPHIRRVSTLTQASPPEDEATSVLDVDRSYDYVVAEPNLNFAKPAGFMPIDGQRIIVEMGSSIPSRNCCGRTEMSENAAASYARCALADGTYIEAQHQANRSTAREQDIPLLQGISGQRIQWNFERPARVPGDDGSCPVGGKALQHHHRQRRTQVFQGRLRLHPLPEATGGGRSQYPGRRRIQTALNRPRTKRGV